MLDRMLRPVKERIISAPASALANRVHPNTVTLVAFGVSVIAFFCLLTEELLLCALLWLLGRLLDGLDGAVARRSGKQTDFGGYLDMLLDVIAYALIPLGIAITFPTSDVLIATVTLFAAFYVNISSWMYLSALMEKRRAEGLPRSQTSIYMPSGIIEGSETIVFYTLFIAFPDYYVLSAYAMAALTGVTVAQRFVWAIATLSSRTAQVEGGESRSNSESKNGGESESSPSKESRSQAFRQGSRGSKTPDTAHE